MKKTRSQMNDGKNKMFDDLAMNDLEIGATLAEIEMIENETIED